MIARTAVLLGYLGLVLALQVLPIGACAEVVR
jgi:hypothetical protein